MNSLLLVAILSAVSSTELEVSGPASTPTGWAVARALPPQGFRFGLGPQATLNVRAKTDLAGLSAGLHLDFTYTLGRLEGRASPTVIVFGGWNGHDGFGHLITGGVDLSLRYHLFWWLAFGAGAMPALNTGSFQSCSLALPAFGSLGPGGGGCTPAVSYEYVSLTPTLYPIIATLGGERQHEIGLQLSWPVSFVGAYTFPSVMVHYTRML